MPWIRFGQFELNGQTYELRKGGAPVKIQQQPARVLALLVSNAGTLITRDQIRKAIWGSETYVDFEQSLNFCIRHIRMTLNDSADNPVFVETLPRLGYRFIAPVERVDEHSGPPSKAAANSAADLPRKEPSIAVLPFSNISADKENEYFGDGLAEEIINVLAQVPGMKVAGRTSSFFFRGKDIEFGEIGRRLNVEHILEGSIRKVGSRLRVSAQLIKVMDGFHLWLERYDREMTDLFAIQDEITQSIAGALRIKLSLEGVMPRRHVPNLRAYEAFHKGREHLLIRPSPESLARGKELLEHAVKLDPKFALPYSLLGVHYTMQALLRPAREVIPLARAAQQEALRVDPSLPEAHALLGVCAGMDYRWSEAEGHWGLAMAHEPIPRDVLFWYGNHYLLPSGRIAEAVRRESMVLDEDPLNLLYRRLYAIALQHAGRLVDAERELRNLLEIDEAPPALAALGSVCAQQGRLEEALALTERAYALAPATYLIAGQLAALLVRAGAMSRACALIDKLNSDQPYGASAKPRAGPSVPSKRDIRS